jgi:hypothetical protein
MQSVTSRRTIVLATLAAVFPAVDLLPAAGAAARPAASCDARGGTTVQANAQARVFRKVAKRGFRTYVCYRATRRVTSLGDYAEFAASTIVNDVRLAGRFVADWTESYGKGGDPSVLVVVWDARTGRSQFHAPLSTPQASADGRKVTSLIVTATGTAAWIAGGTTAPATYEVHVAAGATDRVLATGGDIDPISLAAANTALYWMQGGQPMAAAL